MIWSLTFNSDARSPVQGKPVHSSEVNNNQLQSSTTANRMQVKLGNVTKKLVTTLQI